MIIGACIALFALAIPCLLLVGSGNDWLIFLGLMLLGLALVCFTSSMPSTLPALFYTPVRYSALSIAFNVSVSLFGGTTPLITAWLVERTGDPLVPAYYLMGAAVIGLVTMLFVNETANLPLRGSPPAVASEAEAHALLRSDEPVTVDATQPQLPEAAVPSEARPA
jgi:MHS family proline/betaine transporter-like MFS transporter